MTAHSGSEAAGKLTAQGMTGGRAGLKTPKQDLHPTPPGATYDLLLHERVWLGRATGGLESGEIWEPACGGGHIATVLRGAGFRVEATDLYNTGFGEAGVDFLQTVGDAAAIVTNPPFSLAEAFARHAIAQAPYVAMLFQTMFLGSVGRHMFWTEHPPSVVYLFSRPLPFKREGAWERGAFQHLWVVWDRDRPTRAGETKLAWLEPR